MKDVMLRAFIQAGSAQPSGGSGRCYRRESGSACQKEDVSYVGISRKIDLFNGETVFG